MDSDATTLGLSRQRLALTHRESHPGAIVPSPRNHTEGRPPESGSEGAGPMRIRERYELAEELRSRYRGSGRVERGQLLDSFCLAVGYGRKYAITLLRGRRRVTRRRWIPGPVGTDRGSGSRSRSVGRPPTTPEPECRAALH